MMNLTEKETKFIAKYKKLYWSYVMFLIFISVFAALQLYLIFSKLMPMLAKISRSCPDAKVLIEFGLTKCISISLIWLLLLLGVTVGNFFTYRIIRRILDKNHQNHQTVSR